MIQKKQQGRSQPIDPFGGEDIFQSAIGNMMSRFDPFNMNSDFDNLHTSMNNRVNQLMNMNMNHQDFQGSGGYSISKSYVSSTTIGPDGQKKTQQYFDNNVVHRDREGQTIGERQQGYKDSSGYKQIAQERMLNDKGRKHVKEMDRNNQINTYNYYHNMDEGQKDIFDQAWNSHCEKVDFHSGIQKYLGGNSRHVNAIQNESYQPKSYQNQNNFQQQPSNIVLQEFNRIDDQRRGDYISPNARQIDQPVQINKQKAYRIENTKNSLPMPDYQSQTNSIKSKNSNKPRAG